MVSVTIEDLQRTESDKLLRFFRRRLGNQAAAVDALQETFLRFLTACPRQPIENPHAYLFQIASNVALAVQVKVRSERSLFVEYENSAAIADARALPDHIVTARQNLRAIAQTIDELPPRCREVFFLSRFNGLANGEIAARLGISRNMVEKHIIRALLQCRACRDRLS